MPKTGTFSVPIDSLEPQAPTPRPSTRTSVRAKASSPAATGSASGPRRCSSTRPAPPRTPSHRGSRQSFGPSPRPSNPRSPRTPSRLPGRLGARVASADTAPPPAFRHPTRPAAVRRLPPPAPAPRDSPAIAAAESGRRVYYGTLTELINSLEEAPGARAAQPLAQNPQTQPVGRVSAVRHDGLTQTLARAAMACSRLGARRPNRVWIGRM